MDPRKLAIDYIEANKNHFLEKLFELLRRPSISSQNIGVRECGEALAAMVRGAGMDARVMETGGQPVVFAERLVDPALPTVLFYGHYDVQPPEPLEDWVSPPFEPTIRDGRIFARGAADNKGQFLCHVLAVEAWQKAAGTLPLNVKMIFDGEEESGSVSLETFVSEHREMLAADLVYTSDGPMHESGRPYVLLGVRGILYVELRARGARWDNHSGNKGGIVPNPAWILIDLLRTMRDPDGNILIKGFYDDVEPPSERIMELVRALPFDREKIRETVGYDALDLDPETYYRRLLLEPTFNIAGFGSGYLGEGMKTIIPGSAVLKMDMRLVVNQDPDDIFDKFEAHVRNHAPGVVVKKLSTMAPSRTSPDIPEVARVIDAVRSAYNTEPVIQPTLGGSLPDAIWTRTMGIPSVMVPYANADESNHSPNENLVVERFFDGIRCTCCVLSGLGGMKKGKSQ
jgi:acetylornithine deacetylase/succinyl-diaminopimelate desuccinylase-like protein